MTTTQKPQASGAADSPTDKTETSLIARFVAILTPVFASLAGLLAGR